MESNISPSLLEARNDLLSSKRSLLKGQLVRGFSFDVTLGRKSLWVLVKAPSGGTLALRAAYNPAGRFAVGNVSKDGCSKIELSGGSLGAIRVAIEGGDVLHCQTAFTPRENLRIDFWPRDLYPCGSSLDPCRSSGVLHTKQRGLRTGVVFGSADKPAAFTFLYLQNFSALSAFHDATRSSPADTVGGVWPELGYAPPAGQVALPKSQEVVISDVYLALWEHGFEDERQSACLYLDLLAKIYTRLPQPATTYHHWPDKAAETLRHLSFSPACTTRRRKLRYALPYVEDDTKPPESMVQFTVMLPMLEYARWSRQRVPIVDDLLGTVDSFYDSQAKALVRWLPGERFKKTPEDDQRPTTMDSWYFYHSLFNLSRVAKSGNQTARRLFRKSLPYAVRVARRFDYRWPVFFDTHSLEIVRGETEPGKGGENDVAGLYALVMLQALDLFKTREYLDEAERAAATLIGLGFKLGYQMNTTGFGAEAMLRLWKRTRKRFYLDMSHLCLANMLDNMWIWECKYGYGKDYRTFFGLFPLREAPYLAAYEELEMVAKVHDYLNIGRDAIRPSVRLLLSEYARHALDRAWSFFPSALPAEMLAPKPRNGRIDRNLSVPLEDLQDGWAQSGQVGQEVYGSGLASVMTTRHFRPLDDKTLLYCDYPMFDFTTTRSRNGTHRCSFSLAGTTAGECAIRIISTAVDVGGVSVKARLTSAKRRRNLKVAQTVEGHWECRTRGGQRVALTIGRLGR